MIDKSQSSEPTRGRFGPASVTSCAAWITASVSLTDLAFNDLNDLPKLGFGVGTDSPDAFLKSGP